MIEPATNPEPGSDEELDARLAESVVAEWGMNAPETARTATADTSGDPSEFKDALQMVSDALDEEPSLTHPPYLVMQRLAHMVLALSDLSRAALAARDAEVRQLREQVVPWDDVELWLTQRRDACRSGDLADSVGVSVEASALDDMLDDLRFRRETGQRLPLFGGES
jgi:hypothetical protein